MLTKTQTVTLDVTVPVDNYDAPRYVLTDAFAARLGANVGYNVEVKDAGPVVEQTPELNEPELLRLLGWAAVENAKKQAGKPSEWNQGDWIAARGIEEGSTNWCGTACCIAGKAVIDSGLAAPVWWECGSYDENDQPILELRNGTVEMVDGSGTRKVESLARELLGVTRDEGSRLFDGGHSLVSLSAVVLAIIESRRPKPSPAPVEEVAPAPEVVVVPAPGAMYHDPTVQRDCPYDSEGCDCNVKPAERERRAAERQLANA